MRSLLLFSILFLALVPSAFTQDCSVAFATQPINSNNISTLVPANGNLFNPGNSDASFQIPILEETNTIFTQGLWLGAVDPAGNLKVAAQTFSSSLIQNTDYYAGPLNETGTTNSETCQEWDRVWNVYRYQIEAHIMDFNDNGIIDNPIPEIMAWPAQDNTFFSDFNDFELPSASQGLAPFFDQNNDGSYDPAAGDYPLPPRTATIPDQMTWNIFNDAGNGHFNSNGEPLNMEIQLTTWVYSCTDTPQLNNTLFSSYKLINRGTESLDSLHLGSWVDFDLGCFENDYVGTAADLNTTFVYNGENVDGPCSQSINGYGENPPVQAMTILNKALSSSLYMSSFGGSVAPFGDPNNATEFYRYLTGHWPDGSPLRFGGNGSDPADTTPVTNFIFSGDPNDPDQWSALNAGVPFGDIRSISSINLGNLAPGAVEEIDIAYSYFREPSANNLENVTAMYAGIESLQSWYNDGFQDICSQITNCEEDCVWAGDLNADGIANHCDLLAIAVAENTQGPTRGIPYNWTPQSATDWTDAQSSGANYKHLDGDGNGTISLEDFQLTVQHYNLTVIGYEPPPASYPEGPELIISPPPVTFIDFDNLMPGDNTSFVRIRLETEVPDLYALAFTVEYDPLLFEFVGSSTPGFNINNGSFSTGPNDPVTPGNSEFAFIATEGTIESGQLSFLEVQVRDELPDVLPTNTTQIRFKNIKAIQSDGTEIPVGGTSITATFPDIMVETEEELLGQRIQLFPNPTDGRLELRFPGKQLDGLSIYDMRGVAVWQQQRQLTDETSLDLHHLESGIYFLRIQLNGAVVVRRLIIQ